MSIMVADTFSRHLGAAMADSGFTLVDGSSFYGSPHPLALSAKFTYDNGKELFLVVTLGAMSYMDAGKSTSYYLLNAMAVAEIVLRQKDTLPARLQEGSELPLWVTLGDVEEYLRQCKAV